MRSKVLVRLGEINNGEPVDVAVVVMAPELADSSAKLAEATFEANWGPNREFLRIDGRERRRARCGAASPWRAPPRRPSRLRVAAASQSPSPASTGASRRPCGSGKFIYIQPGRPRIDDMLVGSVRKVSDYEFTFTIAGGYYGSQNWNIIHDRYFFSDVRSNECATLLNPPLARLQFGDGTGAIREASPARFGDQRARPRRPPPSRAFDEA